VKNSKAAMLLIGLLTLFRLIYSAQMGLAFDEAYYWQWSRHLDIYYYDQGPWIAYSIKLGTLLLGHTLLGVRLLTVLYAAGTGVFVFQTARLWFGERVALWTLILLSIAPLYAAGSVIATYDGPQVFFWSAALLSLTKALQTKIIIYWYLLGIIVALGILAKLTMLLFAPGVLLLLIFTPTYRDWLKTPHPYLAFAIALLALIPMFLWNKEHAAMNFLHTQTLSKRHSDAAFGRWLGDFLAGQLLVVGPLIWLLELWVLVRIKRLTEKIEARVFLLAFTLPSLLVCLFTSLRSKLEINWPAPMHLVGLMAVAVLFDALWRRGKRGLIGAACGLSIFVSALGFFPEIPGWLGLKLPSNLGIKLNEPYGWPEIATATQKARATLEAEGRSVVVAGINYRVNSIAAFYLNDQPETYGLYFNARRDQYFIWTDPTQLIGKSVVFIEDGPDRDGDIDIARRYFASVEPLPPVKLTRPGYDGVVKEWYLYLCRDFKGYDPTAHLTGY
jgi:4-amino-4-deoxy-L-arabinose transferase-like glycosyltransferase